MRRETKKDKNDTLSIACEGTYRLNTKDEKVKVELSKDSQYVAPLS